MRPFYGSYCFAWVSADTGNLQIPLHISLGQLPISRGGYLGDVGRGRFGCHNDWGPLLAFSKQGPGMLNVLQCAGLSYMMQNFPTPRTSSTHFEKRGYSLGCLVLLDADTMRAGWGEESQETKGPLLLVI